MELVYGALLLHAAKKEINEENMKKVLSGAGIKVDEAKIKALVASLEGVKIEDVISKAAMPVATAAPAEKKEEKKEKKKEDEEDTEKKAEKAVEGLAGLFG